MLSTAKWTWLKPSTWRWRETLKAVSQLSVKSDTCIFILINIIQFHQHFFFALNWNKLKQFNIISVKCAGSRSAFFAEKLYLAMKVTRMWNINKHSQFRFCTNKNDLFFWFIRVKVPARTSWLGSWWADLRSIWNSSRKNTRKTTEKHCTKTYWWADDPSCSCSSCFYKLLNKLFLLFWI